MTDAVFFGLLIGTQAFFVLADVYERYRMPQEHPRPPASFEAVRFMGAVLLTYFVIQGVVGRIAPGPQAVVDRVTVALGGTAVSAVSVRPEPGVFALALAVLVGLYIGGLADYLVHRFVSHSRPLFFTHEYHHLPSEVFLLMPGLAARPFAVVASFPVTVATALAAYGTLAVLGQPVVTATPMQCLLIAHVTLLVTSHSAFLRRWRGAHVVMTRLGLTTPHEHLLHHTTDLRGNYANLTTVWDRVFGTYIDPDVVTMEGRRLGLDYDQDWLGAVTLSYFKLPAHLRKRFDVGRWCNLTSDETDAARSAPDARSAPEARAARA